MFHNWADLYPENFEENRPRGFLKKNWCALTNTAPFATLTMSAASSTPFNTPEKAESHTPPLDVSDLSEVRLTSVQRRVIDPHPDDVTVVWDSEDDDAREDAAANRADFVAGKRAAAAQAATGRTKRAATDEALGGVKDALERVKSDVDPDYACTKCGKRGCLRQQWSDIESFKTRFSYDDVQKVVLDAVGDLTGLLADSAGVLEAFKEEYPENLYDGEYLWDMSDIQIATRRTFEHYIQTQARRRSIVFKSSRELIDGRYIQSCLDFFKN